MLYTELQITSNFSFLRGASHPEELVAQAHALGYRAIALTDLHTLAGIVRAHQAAKEYGIKFIVGAKLELYSNEDFPTESLTTPTLSILVYPKDRQSYGALCRLLTIGQRRTEKGGCLLSLFDYLKCAKNFISILIPPKALANSDMNFLEAAKLIKEASDPSLSLAVTKHYLTDKSIHYAHQFSEHLELPLVVTNDVFYHVPNRRPLQDVLSCIRNKCTIEQAGLSLFENAERFLKPPQEMRRLFREMPKALTRTEEISAMLSFTLDELRYEYPLEICPQGKSHFEYLWELTWEGAKKRYPQGTPPKISEIIEQELALIRELNYERYFLTCYDIVKFARQKNILCQGRGAAANSAVCYCLGITSVDPTVIDLLFARFISKERNEPPDIDIDFEHERREEVIQYIYQKYGRDRAGISAEVVTYRHRSAVREVGKALGLSLDTVDKLAKSIHRWTECGISASDLRELGLSPDDTTIKNTLTLSHEILGFPRHLSQHVGGFIISEKPLCETVPILNAAMPDRTIIEWDKDDIDTLGMLKIDVLGLGMLTCIRKALHLINRKRLRAGESIIELHTIPREDPAVYDMICAADTIGVFQIESRAQMSMLPRLRPRCFYDLVIEVAIVRPGPIQGNMVHPYLKRRNGLEKAIYPDQRVKDILDKTLGVPLFQEQAMRLAIVLGSFSPGEAERLRRAMAAWKRNEGAIAAFEKRIISGMLKNGYTQQFAESCVSQIKGFSEYGFPESHAASFALLVYASAWIKRHYPAEFACALLNSQPMGFYAPSQIVRDAENHGVKIYPIDVNKSTWDCLMQDGGIRLGLRLVKGLEKTQAEIITQAVQSYGEFVSIQALWNTINSRIVNRLRKPTLRALARADAFSSMRLDRHQAFWQIRDLPECVTPIDLLKPCPAPAPLPSETTQQAMFSDYAATGLSLKAHPIGLIRAYLDSIFVSPAATLKSANLKIKNTLVSVAGIAIIRQRPGTAKGMVFVTLEDETGIVNLIIRPDIFELYHKIIISSSCILAHGRLERVGEVIYINTTRVENLDQLVLATKKVALPSKSYSY